jgi:hypothetical protein
MKSLVCVGTARFDSGDPLTDGQRVRALLRPSILVPRTTEGRPPNVGVSLPTRAGTAGFEPAIPSPPVSSWASPGVAGRVH